MLSLRAFAVSAHIKNVIWPYLEKAEREKLMKEGLRDMLT